MPGSIQPTRVPTTQHKVQDKKSLNTTIPFRKDAEELQREITELRESQPEVLTLLERGTLEIEVLNEAPPATHSERLEAQNELADYWTRFYKCANNGIDLIAKLENLLAAPSIVDELTNLGRAVLGGEADRVKTLMTQEGTSYSDIISDHSTSDGRNIKSTALGLAISKEELNVINVILENGASPADVVRTVTLLDGTVLNTTAWQQALQTRNDAVIEALIAHGSSHPHDLRTQPTSDDAVIKETALGHAIKNVTFGGLGVGVRDIKTFLANGASPKDIVNTVALSDGTATKETALGLSIQEGKVGVMHELLANGASLRDIVSTVTFSDETFDKKTALGLAIEQEDVDTFKALFKELIESGASLLTDIVSTRTFSDGTVIKETALQLALRLKNDEVIEALKAKGATLPDVERTPPSPDEAASQKASRTNSGLSRRTDADGTVIEETALGRAIEEGNVELFEELIQELIERGASLTNIVSTRTDTDGKVIKETALGLAFRLGNREIVKELFNNGASHKEVVSTQTDSDGTIEVTAFGRAIEEGFTDEVDELLAKEAAHNEFVYKKTSSDGGIMEETGLGRAVRSKKIALIKKFRSNGATIKDVIWQQTTPHPKTVIKHTAIKVCTQLKMNDAIKELTRG
ncbi:hypothetical protein DID78_05740 [Candidatus Marinamargulisbacteria bacterium SCGC AG-343-D04]|nr:hypothetical protein DID78_05740 [Candidatus Marinamargulisbacteria bacterium SCGC AG-343-D04]